MNNSNNWHLKILEIDLTNCISKEVILPDEIYSLYIGARGLGVYLFCKYYFANPQWYPLVISVGPLTGSGAPGGVCFTLTTKSTLTGGINTVAGRGNWGVELAWSGYDALVITGKAKEPVYIDITCKGVEVKSAFHLWGKTTSEILDYSNKENKQALFISTAGENRLPLATLVSGGDLLIQGGGIGRVWGEKYLKAIFVRGEAPRKLSKLEEIKKELVGIYTLLNKNPVNTRGLGVFGDVGFLQWFALKKVLPIKNFSLSFTPDALFLSGEALYKEFTLYPHSCYACPINCQHHLYFQGRKVVAPSYTVVSALGLNPCIFSWHYLIAIYEECIEQGIDPVSWGATLSLAMRISELGLARILFWGKGESALELTKKLKEYKHFSYPLHLGSKELARHFNLFEELFQIRPGVDLVGLQPWAGAGYFLSLFTSPYGGGWLSSFIEAIELMGIPKRVSRFSPATRAGILSLWENFSTAVDALGLCRYLQFSLNLEQINKLLNVFTGEKFQPAQLLLVGERIWNLETVVNYYLQVKIKVSEPVSIKNLFTHFNISYPIEEMWMAYCKFRGWQEEGLGSRKKLLELGLL